MSTTKAFVALLFAASMLLAQGGHAPLMGQVKNSSGNLSWLSSVKQKTRVDWGFHYNVRNNDKHRACHIAWKPAELNGIILSGSEGFVDKVYAAQPIRKLTSLVYNGGTAAGDKSTETTVWVPNKDAVIDGAEGHVHIFVMIGNEVFPIDIKAVTSSEKGTMGGRDVYRIKYELSIAPFDYIPRSEEFIINTDVGKMLGAVDVQWKSIISPLWKSHKGQTKAGNGSASPLGKMKLSQSKESKEGTYSFTATIMTSQPPKLVDKAIVFRKEDGTKVASGGLPSIAVVPEGK